jgi:sulfur carrier protein
LNLIRIIPAQGSVERFFERFRIPGTLFFCLETFMKLTVNGETHEHTGAGTIDALLEELGANKAHAALMVNGEVIPSGNWKNAPLNENDEVEMLVFVGGG